MLVLTRKVGEEIIIGNNIRITVTALAEGRVKLGITAPAHIRVDRSEVADRITGKISGNATRRLLAAQA